VQAAADRQLILLARNGAQICLFVFGWQSLANAPNRASAAQGSPINLLEGIVVHVG
jgi:hypothetical protein